MIFKLQEVVQIVQVVVWGIVQEQVVFLVEEAEEEMEGQEKPGQVGVEHCKLDLAHEGEAVVEEW